MKEEWVWAEDTTRFPSRPWLLQVAVTIRVGLLRTEALMVAVALVHTMEAEAQGRVLLACPRDLPAPSRQAFLPLHLVTRLRHQGPPALASLQPHRVTWPRLRPHTTLRRRRGTDRLHRRHTRPRLPLVTHPHPLSTLPHRPITALRHRRSWEERHPQHTARHHHNTVRHPHSTAPPAHSIKLQAIAVAPPHRRLLNTARRRPATLQRAQQGLSLRHHPDTARHLQGRPTPQRKYPFGHSCRHLLVMKHSLTLSQISEAIVVTLV